MLWMVASVAKAGQRPGDWSGDYPPCDAHAELLKHGSMDIGVRFSTASGSLAVGFARAMDFWASLLDMKWHPVENRDCAIQILDGHTDLFEPGQVARAQFPTAPSFQGWIAFNPGISLPPGEAFLTAVHEIGHLLAVPHSSNASSVMYFLRIDGPLFLDEADFEILARHHKLRTVGNRARVLVDCEWVTVADACRVRRSPSAHRAATLASEAQRACFEGAPHAARYADSSVVSEVMLRRVGDVRGAKRLLT